jgi:hypothetical protein
MLCVSVLYQHFNSYHFSDFIPRWWTANKRQVAIRMLLQKDKHQCQDRSVFPYGTPASLEQFYDQVCEHVRAIHVCNSLLAKQHHEGVERAFATTETWTQSVATSCQDIPSTLQNTYAQILLDVIADVRRRTRCHRCTSDTCQSTRRTCQLCE